jgi:hypothetical protein
MYRHVILICVLPILFRYISMCTKLCKIGVGFVTGTHIQMFRLCHVGTIITDTGVQWLLTEFKMILIC